jgi:hypothetical protein
MADPTPDDPFSKPCPSCGGSGIYKHEHKGCYTEYDLETHQTFCPLPTSRRCDSCDGVGSIPRAARLQLRDGKPPLVVIDDGNPLVLFEIGKAYVAPPTPSNACLCGFGCEKKKGTLPAGKICDREKLERDDAVLLAAQATGKTSLCDCLAGTCDKTTLPAGKKCWLEGDRDQAPAAEPVVAPPSSTKTVTVDITGKHEGLAFDLRRTLKWKARCGSIVLPAAGPGLWEVTRVSDIRSTIEHRHWCHRIDLDVVQSEADAPTRTEQAQPRVRGASRWVIRPSVGTQISAEDYAIVAELPALTVIDNGPKMLLVCAPERVINGMARWFVDWTFAPERAVASPAT